MSLKPSLNDLFLRSTMLLDPRVQVLEDAEFRALLMLVAAMSATQAWTYTPPSDEGLPSADRSLSRICGMTPQAWLSVKPAVSRFFVARGDRWLLAEPWIFVSPDIGVKRPAISSSERAEVMRLSNYRCGYCGGEQGPFDVDHIIPISKGGSNDIANLLLACWPCNRAKGARSPEEWLR